VPGIGRVKVESGPFWEKWSTDIWVLQNNPISRTSEDTKKIDKVFRIVEKKGGKREKKGLHRDNVILDISPFTVKQRGVWRIGEKNRFLRRSGERLEASKDLKPGKDYLRRKEQLLILSKSPFESGKNSRKNEVGRPFLQKFPSGKKKALGRNCTVCLEVLASTIARKF